jgi:hypothetical protein
MRRRGFLRQTAAGTVGLMMTHSSPNVVDHQVAQKGPFPELVSKGIDHSAGDLDDPYTIALWLFDDPSYPNTTLTDAGPNKYDLRLVCGYTRRWQEAEGEGNPPEEPLHVQRKEGIVTGKFGNAVRLPAGKNGSIEWPPNRQRYGTPT